MFFNSLEFFIFLPIVFVLYWFVFGKKLKNQNLLIAIASYGFYGWRDWRFLSLIIFSSLLDYCIGRHGQYTLGGMDKINKSFHWSIYIALILIMFLFPGEEQAFIYFQF